jgi:sugar/nucleoside kinase (ribokinase family)
VEPGSVDLRQSPIAASSISKAICGILPRARQWKRQRRRPCRRTKVAFTPSDTFCVDRHREGLWQLLRGKVDILFANEAEAASMGSQ